MDREKIQIIRRNAIRCNLCGDEIESTHRHDYVCCTCGACAVDGGHDYLRRSYKENCCYAELAVIEVQEQHLLS